MKKFSIVLAALCLCASAVLSGCSAETRIDAAALVQAVTVRQSSDRRVYTFYLLDGGDEAVSTEVSADSLSSAVALAESRYIPSLSLAKLELVLFDKADEAFINDIKYMANNHEISPLTLAAFASDGAMDALGAEKSAFEDIKRRIELLKSNDENVLTNVLSVFNNLDNRKNGAEVKVGAAYVSAEKELKAERTELSLEK